MAELFDEEYDFLEHTFQYEEQYIYSTMMDYIIKKKENFSEFTLVKGIKNFNYNKHFNFNRKKKSLKFDYGCSTFTYLIIEAVAYNNEEVVKFLLDNGADINIYENIHGYTPVTMSIQEMNEKMTKMMLKSKYYNISYIDRNSYNLITFTLENTILSIVKLNLDLILFICKYVLENGGSLDVKNIRNKTISKLDNMIKESESHINVLKILKNQSDMGYVNRMYDNMEILTRELDWDENYEMEKYIKLRNFLEYHDKMFLEKLFYKYPVRLKNNIKTLLIINNKVEEKYYLPKEILLYIFSFIKIIDYY